MGSISLNDLTLTLACDMTSETAPPILVPQAIRALKRSSSCTLCDDPGRRNVKPAAAASSTEPRPVAESAVSEAQFADEKFAGEAIPGGYDRWSQGKLLGEGSFAKVKLVQGQLSEKMVGPFTCFCRGRRFLFPLLTPRFPHFF